MRTRISTTVDEELLAEARSLHGAGTDAGLIDAALRALIGRHRQARHDAAYAAYDEVPLDAPDEWGDLASFRDATAGS